MEGRKKPNNLTLDGYHYFHKNLYDKKNNEITYFCKYKEICPDVKIMIEMTQLEKIIENSGTYNYKLYNLHRCTYIRNPMEGNPPKVKKNDHQEKIDDKDKNEMDN